ncbi:NAD(P)H-binding protein [Microbulbifer sp. MLAF003]|uniref:NAD(P)H-binding protein n=1 Tax=Microbulbifer TaxID=48073 RepID=UPI000363EC29|nr:MULTISPECIES: NAD(P)H-binding protein [Microbulbifer]WHI52854.1 NAD(P)H-binding protein [Microbulbifer sp. MLAF003]
MAKKAIVIGATGLIGSHLVEQLAQEKSIGEIVALTRRPLSFSHPKVRNEQVDFEHLEEYADLFHGDLLFSCLGTTKKQAGGLEQQFKVDVEYQFRAAQLAADNGVAHYLLVSSSGANTKSNSAYLRMKGELEQKILSLPFARISIFRPSLLIGKRADLRPAEKIGAIILPWVCRLPGLHRYRPITGSQVAEKMVAVCEKAGTGVETFTLDELFYT